MSVFILVSPALRGAVCGATLLLPMLAASAQQPLRIAPAVQEPASASDRAARERELEQLRAEQRKAADAEARLRTEIEAIGEDRRRLSATLIETAGRVREIEARAGASETRLRGLDGSEASIRAALDSRRAAIGELLAALQRLGRRPAPPLLVRPQDALEAVRAAIQLGAVLPEMRSEAEALTADLGELLRVRAEIAAEREILDRELASMAQERQRLALLVEERQRRVGEIEKALESEKQRAAALAKQARDLQDLVARIEQDAGGRRSQDGRERTANAPAREQQRLTPAIAFASAKGTLPLPAAGVKLRQFGAQDNLGGTEKGLSLATRAGATVAAPCDGWVVYAGPFRSYGQLLIINGGSGYHILLAGMERISVDLGQFVLTGEPVGIMANGPKSAASASIVSPQPILYVEFRKDGTPIDPSPWWATNESEKVRG
ncbi:MAG: murein hydrolase activator [Variibacter sp.]|nr:murein hydrolase activator [Variibacter sp.]